MSLWRAGEEVLVGLTDGYYDDVIKWKHVPRYWPFVREIHRSAVNSPHKGQWRGPFFDLRLNKRLSKRSWGWWFEMLSCLLWRHCNVVEWHGEQSFGGDENWLSGCNSVVGDYCSDGPLTRYVKLQVAHAPGMPGTFSPTADFKGNH